MAATHPAAPVIRLTQTRGGWAAFDDAGNLYGSAGTLEAAERFWPGAILVNPDDAAQVAAAALAVSRWTPSEIAAAFRAAVLHDATLPTEWEDDAQEVSLDWLGGMLYAWLNDAPAARRFNVSPVEALALARAAAPLVMSEA